MIRRSITLPVLLLVSCAAIAQEQVDKPDATATGPLNLANIALRVRITQATPQPNTLAIAWRRGGEGLGGEVTRGAFTGSNGQPTLNLQEWTKPLPLTEIAGNKAAWQFPTLVVSAPGGRKATPLTNISVDFEFADAAGHVLKSFTETAPDGATVSFALPGAAADRQSFLADLVGLSEHARRRHQRLAALFPRAFDPPRLFGVIGHLAGYGEGSGYGIRHCNPAIVKEECDTLRLLGVNGLVSDRSIQLADAAGAGKLFRHVYWGGPGSGSPMGMLKKRAADPEDACPFDPALAAQMAQRVAATIPEYRRVGADQSWALWWDEIGVAAKTHLQTCPRCREKFVEYLESQKVDPAALGAKSWDEVKPFPIWQDEKTSRLAPAPPDPGDALRYYYTFRFMTHATAQLFVEPAKQFKAADILLYAMQGPTPSWAGHSLDWHEFYDAGGNTAMVFETSNRDPRAWQFESYLADIARGICQRHDLPLGVLVKPHRGAVEQRMLALAARGASVIEWYTYGPDYAKGDSFSQSPELLQHVATAARFLAANEQYLYRAKPAVPVKVAFCSPRSSEIWGKATDLGVTAFEDAKWVYIALRHANVPVDVLSEQQLAEGQLDPYKVIYVVGPNVRRDAAEQLKKWVEAGGTLWTDAMGLSRDEANQPAYEDLTGLNNRELQTWGTVEPYKATELKPITAHDVPQGTAFVASSGITWQPAVGRELIDPARAKDPIAQFTDGHPAGVVNLVGRGQVWVLGVWAGLTYSADVRRPDFDMSRDFDPRKARRLVTLPVMEPGHVSSPAITSVPTVEAVALVKDGHRSIALMNWAYRRDTARGDETLIPARDVRVELRGLGDIRHVRSSNSGELKLRTVEPGKYSVTLPKLDTIDLLVLD